jgi:hypothetical protein
MDSLKPWYYSKTVWASMITIAASLGSMAGVPLTGLDPSTTADALLQAVTAVSGVIALFGRLTATSRLG